MTNPVKFQKTKTFIRLRLIVLTYLFNCWVRVKKCLKTRESQGNINKREKSKDTSQPDGSLIQLTVTRVTI